MSPPTEVAQRIEALTEPRRGVSWAAFFALAIVTALAIAFNAWSYREGQRNTIAASKAQCQVSHLTRQALVSQVNRENAPVLIPADASPELRADLEKQNAENEAYREKTLRPLRQLSCREVGDVPAPSPQPLPSPTVPSPVPPPMGLRGATGPQGLVGPSGAPGKDGKEGKPGRDGKDGAVVVVPVPTPEPSPSPAPSLSPSPAPSPGVGLPPSPTPPVCVLEICVVP